MGTMQRNDNMNIVRDRVGEQTDLSLCPVCLSHPNCFANIDRRCTALRETAEPCPFYKDRDEHLAEARRCYQRLKEKGRADLIRKYAASHTAMGLLDDEIAEAEVYSAQFDKFRESNYAEQLNKVLAEDLAANPTDAWDTDDDEEDEADDSETDDAEEEEHGEYDGAWDPGGA